MSGDASSRDPAHFERLYAQDADPWGFETSGYEHAKYRATIEALGAARYGRGLEIGCSIGVLTELLAGRCDALLGIDPVESALARARARCATMNHVAFARMFVPADFPAGTFDLIVCSEVLYFLAGADLLRVASLVCAALRPGGVVLLVNYTGRPGEPATGDPLTGDDAAERFIAATKPVLERTLAQRDEGYRIDRLDRRAPAPPVSDQNRTWPG